MSRFSFILGLGKKIPKKIAKKIKKLKNLFPTLFLAQMGGDRPKKRQKKILAPNFVHTWLGEENSQKKVTKKLKKLKNLFPGLFLAKTG